MFALDCLYIDKTDKGYVAFDFSGDFDLLHSSIPGSTEWQVSQLLDLKSLKTMPASLADQGQVIQGGLAGVTQHFLGVTLNKRQQLSNWEKRPLTEEQALYGGKLARSSKSSIAA